jgi:integrase
MTRVKLTAGRIANFSCDEGKAQSFLWCDTVPGLGVRATSGSTGKRYIFQAKVNRHSMRVTIGDVNVWTIDSAKAEARRLQVLIDQGNDPRQLEAAKRQREVDKRAAIEADRLAVDASKRYTLKALLDAYVRHLEARGKTRSAAATKSSFKCHVATHPAIAGTLASAITSRQVAELVRCVQESGKNRAAGILRSYISAAYSAARKAPLDAMQPAELIPYGIEHNPAEAVPAIAVNAGNRTLSADELKAYMAQLGDNLPDMALRIALFAGGQRMAQLLRAKIGDYDADTKTLRLFDPKGKRRTPREHLLPLAPMAAVIMGKLVKRAKATKTPSLFAAASETLMAMETPGKRAAEICTAMKVAPFNLLDIRRTCETMLAGMGISRDTRAHLLSHGLSGVQNTHYDRHEYFDEKRAALIAWEGHLAKISTEKRRPKVAKRPKASA